MTKFSGNVGFKTEDVESDPGVWEEHYIERHMTGAIVRASTVVSNDGVINPNLRMNNNISVVGDQYSFENFSNIRYVVYMNKKWLVSDVEIKRPRIILTLGSVMNE